MRRALIDDMSAVADLQWQWRVEEWSGEPAVDRQAFSASLRAWADRRRRSHPAFVAVKEGRTVGMGWLATLERVPTPVNAARRNGHVQSLYVIPEERGRGVGSALLRRLIEEGRMLGFDHLLVHPSNASIPLYRRHGFSGNGEFLYLRLAPARDSTPRPGVIGTFRRHG